LLRRLGGGSNFFFRLDLNFVELNDIREKNRTSVLSCNIIGQHNFDFNSHDSLFEENVSDSFIDVIVSWLTSVDHITLLKFHGFSSLLLEFSGDDDCATTGLSLVDDATDNGIGGHPDWNLTEQFHFAKLGLGGGAQSFVYYLDDGQFHGVFGIVESLLHQGGQFPDLSSLDTHDFSLFGGSDTDLGLDGGHTNLDSGIAGCGQSLGEEGVQLSVENTVGHEFFLLIHHSWSV